MSDGRILTILVAVVAVMVVGQVISYHPSAFDWDASVDVDDSGTSFSLWTNYATKYSVAVFEGSDLQTDPVFAFYDEKCGGNDSIWKMVDLDLKNIGHELRNRGCDLVRKDAQGIWDMINDPSNSKASLLVTAGLLPCEIYDETPDSLLLKWVEGGGRLYWCGGPIGKYIAYADDIGVVPNYSDVFFGQSNGVYEKNGKSYGPVKEIGKSISLASNNMRFGISESIPGALSFGRSLDGYGTAVSVPKGAGSITVLSLGDGGIARVDLVQTISSGITPHTKLLGHLSGDKVKGTVSGEFSLQTHSDSVTAYVYFGGIKSTNGKSFSFP